MPTADAILEPYRNAPNARDAEHELDRLGSRVDDMSVALGDLYDELAEEAAEDGEWEIAARLQRKALENGCRHRLVAREMHGWYLLKAGATAEGEQVFAELCTERPDDPDVRMTLGHARADAGLQQQALDAFDDALAVAKRRGFPQQIERVRIERRAEREEAGLAVDEDDKLTPSPQEIGHPRPMAWAMAWFPADQRQAALARWPVLADDFADPEAYARRLEADLRTLDHGLGQHPAIAPIDVDRFVAWAAAEGYDPDSGEARSAYAADLLRTGQATAWPPGRNDGCWCGSGRKYKRCCGSA